MRPQVFDFQAYVAQHKDPEARARAMSFGEYAYRGDIKALRTLHAFMPVRMMLSAGLQLWAGWGRQAVLTQSTKASEKEGARVHRAALEAAQALHMPPVQVFLSHQLKDASAHALGDREEVFVAVHTELPKLLDDRSLLFELGRQFGHIQNAHVVYRTVYYYADELANVVLRWVAKPAVMAIQHWRKRATLTADRAGLLACRELDVAIRRMAQQAISTRRLEEDLKLEDVLEALRKDPGAPPFGEKVGAGRLPLHLRVAALRAFSQSQFYLEHIASYAEKGKSLSAVDDELDAMLRG
ncbi:MAG: M48 family metalloprotease [Myxococcota bacterium]|jgi:Zn-dependent protease with chaperone function|nr:M48 family metalloprotease [Myxococcota bacterium]